MERFDYRTLIKPALILLVALIGIGGAAYAYFHFKDDVKEKLEVLIGDTGERVTVDPTRIEILEVKDLSLLYVCSASMEDFLVEQKQDTSRFLGIKVGEKTRKLIVVEKQECYYGIELKEVRYVLVPEDMTVYVEIPEPRYYAFNKSEEVIPDKEKFWRNFNHTPIANKVRKKIKDSFCTTKNLDTAKRNAVNTITKILEEMVGEQYKIKVVSGLSQPQGGK